MKSNLTTVVVEARLLVREALKSLMVRNSYRVICDVGSATDIPAASTSDEPKLVILGMQSADSAIAEAVAIRKLWPDSKIILLYEHILLADFQRLLTSQINGCIPISVSSDTLIGTLDMITIGDIRVMIAPDAKSPPIQPVQPDEPDQSIKATTFQSDHAERRPALSQREVQILDGLVKGYANKVIARTCDITDATVKVHIKSILRKIRVANRTQAAIWALENGHTPPNFTGPLSKLRSDQAAAAITAAAI